MTAYIFTRGRMFQLEVRKPALRYFDSIIRQYSKKNNNAPSFGLLFDIDGVVVRGKKVIPTVPESFRKLVNRNGEFRVPTVFVTNAGNALCKVKAQQLTDWLGIKVTEDKVVMAHTPLKVFYEFHDKRVLVSGQGPVEEIAKRIGFKNIVTVDDVRKAFPLLDAVDHKRRVSMVDAPVSRHHFPQIEAVVLFGEPIRWETTLQLIVDVLMTDGHPNELPPVLAYPHIPVLACNMDLLWMAEASIPRFGHGAFLLCLEELYKKITGKDLIYKALVGKPSEITYRYAHQLILDQAKEIGVSHKIKRLYAIGDNINTDIFGANLYNEFLSERNVQVQNNYGGSAGRLSSNEDNIENCLSVLVKTGVFTHELTETTLDHSPRDFVSYRKDLRKPSYTAEDVTEAIDLIFRLEGFY